MVRDQGDVVPARSSCRMSKKLRQAQASHFRSNHVGACSQGSASLRQPRHSFCTALGGYLHSEHHFEILYSSFKHFIAFFGMIQFGCKGWSNVGNLSKLTGADATQPEVFRKVSTNSWRNSSGPNVL